MVADILGNGLGPEPLGSPGGGGLVAFPCETFQTLLLDLTKTVSGIELVPARNGHVAFQLASFWIIESTTGTQTSPPTVQAGNNGAHTNYIPSSGTTPSNANVAATVAPGVTAGPFAAGNSIQIPINSPVLLDVTSGATGTGNFTLMGRLVTLVTWSEVGDA